MDASKLLRLKKLSKNKTPWQKWYHRVRLALIKWYGGKCGSCGKKLTRTTAQFAHIKPNSISGKGRGSFRRIKDVMKNPANYWLGCHTCHLEYDLDNGMRGPWQ
jgi:5-methylcytosine-specific restriction endonuclease McrA